MAVNLDCQRPVTAAGLGRSKARRRFSMSDRAFTRSVVARPSPPCLRTASRKARLVYPAKGARKNREGISVCPSKIGSRTTGGTGGYNEEVGSAREGSWNSTYDHNVILFARGLSFDLSSGKGTGTLAGRL